MFPGATDEGVVMTIVLKRRVMNAIMTIYVPTFLIMIIVYSTNFFKQFFFEAIVTVNLTSLLVLTTLFISVAGSLPATAYIKMVDIWLIFCQLIPFAEVILHTFMDAMRVEGEEGREINHHGRTVIIDAAGNRIEKNETNDVEDLVSLLNILQETNFITIIVHRKISYIKTVFIVLISIFREYK